MRSPWKKLSIESGTIGQGIKGLQSTVEPVIDATLVLLKAAEKIADIIEKLYVDISDPMALALKAACKAIRAVIKAIAEDAGVYMLVVPLPILTDPGPNANTLALLQLPAGANIPPAYGKSIASQRAEDAQPGEQSVFLDKLDDVASVLPQGNGGNAGFLGTVRSSMVDALDSNRPQFDQDDYVGGMVLLYGAPTYYAVIKILKYLIKLLQLPNNTMDDQRLPRPKNVGAEFVASAGLRNLVDETPKNLYAVKLNWDQDPVDWALLVYGDVHYKIREVRVYRSEQPITRVTPVGDLKEIWRKKYAGSEDMYYDADFPQDPKKDAGKTLYYAVGYALAEATDGFVYVSDPVDLSVVSLQLPQVLTASTTHGIPPDWIACNLMTLIPQVRDIVNAIYEYIDKIEESTEGGKDRVKEFVDFLNSEVHRYSAWATNILATLKLLLQLLQAPKATIATFFFEGRGGNDFLTQTLAEALTDTSDPDRPAFDLGTEMVGGIVFYSGGGIPSEVQKTWTLFKAIFGEGGMIENAFLDAEADIDRVITEVESQICLSDAFIPIACEAEVVVPPGFGPNMEPDLEDCGC